LRAVIGLAVLLALGSACDGGADTPADPCLGVSCSFYGICITDGVSPYCSCQAGYHPVGLACIPNNPDDPCDGVDCSGHGDCRVAADLPVCDCDPDYRADSSGLLCLPHAGADADADAEPDADADADPDAEIPDDTPADDADVPDDGDAPDDGETPECSSAIDCDDDVPCTTDDCAGGRCTHVPNHAACTDDGIACTREICDPTRGGCVSEPDDALCPDDGVACTAEACHVVLGCVAPPDPSFCDDSIACTVDACDPSAGCTNAPDHAACAAGELCRPAEGGCVAVSCTGPADCDDRILCNGIEYCDASNDCRTGPPPDCGDGIACTIDRCDARLDLCVHDLPDADRDTHTDARCCTAAPACGTDCNDADPAVRPGAPEICNGIDDNCDSAIDTDTPAALLAADPANCGACGNVCRTTDTARYGTCSAATCGSAACPASRWNIDGLPLNQCEYECTRATPPDELCNRTDDDCDGETDEGFDLNSNVLHCGACGHACADDVPAGTEIHGTLACSAGSCRIASCDVHYFDLDRDHRTGCEYFHDGGTLYVDAISGNDTTGSGSAALPFRTIGRATGVAVEGDTIQLVRGPFVENVVLARNYVRLRGNPATPSTVSIRGGSGAPAISITGQHVQVEGVSVLLDGNQPAIGAADVASPQVLDMIVVEASWSGQYAISLVRVADPVVRRVTVTGVSSNASQGAAIYVTGDRCEVSHNIVNDFASQPSGGGVYGGSGIRVTCTAGTISGNRLTAIRGYNSSIGFGTMALHLVGSSDIRVVDNVLANLSRIIYGSIGGIVVDSASRNVTLIGNVVSDLPDGYGLHVASLRSVDWTTCIGNTFDGRGLTVLVGRSDGVADLSVVTTVPYWFTNYGNTLVLDPAGMDLRNAYLHARTGIALGIYGPGSVTITGGRVECPSCGAITAADSLGSPQVAASGIAVTGAISVGGTTVGMQLLDCTIAGNVSVSGSGGTLEQRRNRFSSCSPCVSAGPLLSFTSSGNIIENLSGAARRGYSLDRISSVSISNDIFRNLGGTGCTRAIHATGSTLGSVSGVTIQGLTGDASCSAGMWWDSSSTMVSIVDSVVSNVTGYCLRNAGSLPGGMSYSYSDLWNCSLGAALNAADSGGNISADPRFVDAAGGDLHLLADSPCIDTGDPASPYRTEPSPNGCRVNMGAYGNTAEATSRTGAPHCP
jgi:hypothetical protein